MASLKSAALNQESFLWGTWTLLIVISRSALPRIIYLTGFKDPEGRQHIPGEG